MRHTKLLIFIVVVSTAVLLLPNPESLIVRVVEYAGLVSILARGLMGHYYDFLDVLEEKKRRRYGKADGRRRQKK